MTAFSPGPWRWVDKDPDEVFEDGVLVDAEGQPVGVHEMLPYQGAWHVANRRLIAKAPKMHELLQSLTGDKDPQLWIVLRTKARALLAEIDIKEGT